MSSEYLSQSPNEFFVFLFGEDSHIYAKLHRRLVRQEIRRFCHYIAITPKELRSLQDKILAHYYLEYKMKRLDSNINLHLKFYNCVWDKAKEFKRNQIKEERLQDDES